MSKLCSTDFPIYSVCVLDKRFFYITGGGGKAKTGIPNALEVYKLVVSDADYVAERVHRYDMKDELVMQSVACGGESPWNVAASVGSSCHIYSIKRPFVNESDSEEEIKDEVEEVGAKRDSDNERDSISLKKEEVIREEVAEKGDKDESAKGKDWMDDGELISDKDSPDSFKITKTASVTTDSAVKDSCQNVVRFFRNGERVVTGGEDGTIRVWSLPVLKPKEDMKGHKAEVTDITVHPSKQLCVSVSRDCTCRVWDLEDYSELKSFKWTQYGEYRFRACNFSVDGKSLFTLNIPLKWNRSKQQHAYIIKWDSTKWSQVKRVTLRNAIPSALAVSKNHVAIGNVDGDITVLTTDLKPFLKIKAVHTSFVTDLCFITNDSSNQQSLPFLLSTSVDRKCCVTVIDKKGSNTVLFLLLLVLIALIGVVIAHFNSM